MVAARLTSRSCAPGAAHAFVYRYADSGVEHLDTHPAGLGLRPDFDLAACARVAHPQQVVDDHSQAETGAGSFPALVQDEIGLLVCRQQLGNLGVARIDRGQGFDRRTERQVAQVEAIGARIERELPTGNPELAAGHVGLVGLGFRAAAQRHCEYSYRACGAVR